MYTLPCSHLNRGRLEESVAEHLDHLHYIGDIQSLGVEPLNAVLVDHLLNRLLIPLYVYSLSDQAWPDEVCVVPVHVGGTVLLEYFAGEKLL